MGKYIFIIAGLLFLLIYNVKRKGHLQPSSFLISIYLLSSVCCVIDIIVNDQTYGLRDKYWTGAIVFLILITGYLFPYVRVNENKWSTIKLPSLKILNVFSTILICLSFFSMFFYITDVISVFTSGDLEKMREMMNGNQGEYSNSGIINTMASVSASFYDVVILLFFIYNVIGGNKKRKVLLLIASFSYTIQALTYVGRDGIVFWLFSFVFDYLLFKDFLNADVKTKIKKSFAKVVLIAMIPFMAITVSRFGDSDTGSGGGVVSYIGQPIYHWCLFYGMEHKYLSPGNGWPLYYEVTGVKQPEDAGLWDAEGTFSWSFGTFLRSWYSSIGMTGIILIMLFMWLVFFLVYTKTRRGISFHSLFIYLLFFEIISQGVFYFKFGTRGGNLSIVLMFALFYLFRNLEKNSKVVLKKISFQNSYNNEYSNKCVRN